MNLATMNRKEWISHVEQQAGIKVDRPYRKAVDLIWDLEATVGTLPDMLPSQYLHLTLAKKARWLNGLLKSWQDDPKVRRILLKALKELYGHS